MREFINAICIIGVVTAAIVAVHLVILPAPAAPGPTDLTYQQLGPCHWWQAHTEKGEKFLKELPEKYRAPNVETRDGVEAITGRDEYNPRTRSVYASPSVRRQIEIMAEKGRLKVEEYDPYDKK